MRKTVITISVIFCILKMGVSGDIIALSWDQVMELGMRQNLELHMLRQDVSHQKLNVYRAMSDFLPTVNYSFQAVNNVELPVLVFMGNQFRIGTKYNFTHALQAQYPLFLGGARIVNLKIQNHARKSLLQMLKGKEEEIVLKAIEAYFQVILSRDLLAVSRRAQQAARANFQQVKKFYEAGAASQLDFLRAQSKLSQTIPAVTSALNALRMSEENLKFVLNISVHDSVVVLDSLVEKDFLGPLKEIELPALQQMAQESRPDLKSLEHQLQIGGQKEWLAGSRFLPQIVAAASVQHQAFLETAAVKSEDYTRAKAASISLQWPLFEGGKRVLEWQQAVIQKRKAAYQKELLKRTIMLEVKNNWNQFRLSKQNLKSLKQAFEEAKETLRLANLTYKEGVSTQVEVLNAQTAFTDAEARYRKGIFDYNIAQLKLLKALGKLHWLWQSNGTEN
ncbi:TolC family protein [Calditrichota bacterium LG25]